MTEQQPKGIVLKDMASKPEVKNSFLSRRDDIWKRSYKKEKYAEAREAFSGLLQEATEAGVGLNVSLKIRVGLGWSIYQEQRLGGAPENTAYKIVEEPLERNADADVEPETRSDLVQIAGLSRMANVDKLEAKGQKDEAEGNRAEAKRLLGLSLKAAEESGDKNTIGAANNGIGIELNKEGFYKEAIPFLKSSATLHEEAGDNKKAGNAYNNLITSYARIDDLDGATEAEAEAQKLYERFFGHKKSNFSFGARKRLAVALETSGKKNKNKDHLERALAIRKKQIELRVDGDPYNKDDEEKIKEIEAKIDIINSSTETEEEDKVIFKA